MEDTVFLDFISTIINVKNNNGAFTAVVLEVGGGDDYTILGEQFPSLHLFDLATKNNVGGCKNNEFIVSNIQSPVATDHLIYAIPFFGNVTDVVVCHLLCHLPTVGFAIGVLFAGKELEHRLSPLLCIS